MPPTAPPPLADKFSVPLKDIDPKKLVVATPAARGYHVPQDAATWAMHGPFGRDSYDVFGRPRFVKERRVTSKDNWETVAQGAKLSVADLIKLNFYGITEPAVVNYFLRVYVGCRKTRDGYNCSFSDGITPGFVWVPQVPGEKPPKDAWRKKYGPLDCSIHPMPTKQVLRMKTGHSTVTLSGVPIRAGKIYGSTIGRRLILNAYAAGVDFILLDTENPAYQAYVGKVLSQRTVGCAEGELLGEAAGIVLKSTAGLKEAAEWEMEILMGLATGGAGRLGKLAGTIAGGLDYLLSTKSDNHLYLANAVVVTWRELRALQETSPVLCEVLLRGAFGRALTEIGGAVPDNPTAALAGWLIGDMGADVLSGKLDAAKYMVEAVKKLTSELRANRLKNAADAAVAEYKEDSAKFAARLQAAGIRYTPDDERRILGEITKHPHAVERAMTRIAAALAPIK